MSREVLFSGSMGIDARRAATKIRDHLLANPATWLCEVARVAIASGAGRMAIETSATGILVEWDGSPMSVDVIRHFGRHLLSDEPLPTPNPRGSKVAAHAPTDRRAELLTLAAFAALGDVAKAISLSIVELGTSSATAVRRRLQRREIEGVLDQPAEEQLGSHPVSEAFRLIPGASGAIALELPIDLAAAMRLVGLADEPLAFGELRRRIGTGLAVVINGEPLAALAPEAVLSFELPPLGACALRLDLLDCESAAAEAHFYELGVEVAHVPLLAPAFSAAPLRLMVSGPQIATNVSRSQVDEALAKAARAAFVAALPTVLDGLRSAIVVALEAGNGERHRRLENAAGWLATTLQRASASATLEPELAAAFKPTLDWPLLRDAVGRPLSVADALRRADGGPLFAREQRGPMTPDYEPMVRDVIWRRGVAAENAVSPLADYETIEGEVELGRSRLAALSASPLPFEPQPQAEPFFVYEARDADGFEAKIALDTTTNRPCLVRAFVGPHAIETLSADSFSPLLRYDAAVRWPGVVVAQRDMSRIGRGERKGRLLARLEQHALSALVQRLAQADASSTGKARDLAMRSLVAKLNPRDELMALNLWRVAVGGPRSTSDIAAHAAAFGHLFLLAANELGTARGAPPKRGPLLLLAGDDAKHLAALLPQAQLIDYRPFLARPPATSSSVAGLLAEHHLAHHHLAQHTGEPTVFSVTVGEISAFVGATLAAEGRYMAFHRGELLGTVALPDGRGMVVVTDGELPVLPLTKQSQSLVDKAWRRLLADLAKDPPRMQAACKLPGVRAGLSDVLTRVLSHKKPDRAALAKWPVFLLRTGGRERLVCADELAALFPESIPALEPDQTPHRDRDVLLATSRERRAIWALVMRPCKHVDSAPSAPSAPVTPVVASGGRRSQGELDLLVELRNIAPIPLSRPSSEAAPEPLTLASRVTTDVASTRVVSLTPSPPMRVSASESDVLSAIRELLPEAPIAAPSRVRIATVAPPAGFMMPKPVAPSAQASPPLAAAVAPIDNAEAAETTVETDDPEPKGGWAKLARMFQKPRERVPDGHPLHGLAERISENLYVPNLELRFTREGAAVTFDAKTTTLIIDPEHATIRVLVEAGDVLALVAAAFSEINRELSIITDAEARSALGRLLLEVGDT